jgi:DNA repair protein SbcC/Rad50
VKLHRIMVTNLNSLYGEQGVDLDTDLNGASLFLIQGPTGSGKSTLMDAISLALFGTTPRLDDLRSEQAVAEQVMSRGEGNARAVVEFSKLEVGARVRYRATWMARRARDRADGRMQATTRALERCAPDGTWALEVSDHRNRVVQPEFDRVLEGFTPHDFQRSMLLAQGNFDAMLHADPEERAAILERLTDTAIYQRLGERAARMRGAWEGRLAGLRARLEAISPMGPEALAEAAAAVAERAEVAKGMEAEIARLQGWRDWLVHAAVLTGDVGDAQETLAGVVDREQAAGPRLQELAEHERCEQAFAALGDRDKAADRLAENARLLEEVEAGLPGLVEAAARAGELETGAEAMVSGAQSALGVLRGPAGDAAEATRQAVEAQTEKLGADKAHAKALLGFGEAEERERGSAERVRVTTAQLAIASEHFSALSGDASLAQVLPELEQRAAGIVEARKALEAGRAADRAWAGEISAQKVVLKARREAHGADWVERLVPLRAALDDAVKALGERAGQRDPAVVVASLRGLHEALLGRGSALDAAGVAVRARDEADGKRAGRVVEERTARDAVDEATGRVGECGEAEGLAAAALASREAALVPLERIAALGEQRGELVEGDPCPLCGAEVHPFVNDPAQRAQAEAIEQAVREARSDRDDSLRVREQATALALAAALALAKAQTEANGAERRLAEASDDLVATAGRAAEALERAGLAPEATADQIAVAQAEVGKEDSGAKAQLLALEGAIETDRAAVEALAKGKQALADAQIALDRDQALLEQAQADRAAREVVLNQQGAELARRRTKLAAELAPFEIQAELAEDGLVAARARCKSWELAQVSVDEARTESDKAVAAQKAATEALKTAFDAEALCREAVVKRSGVLDETQQAAERAAEVLQQAWNAAVALDDAAAPRPHAGSAPEEWVRSQEGRVQALQLASNRARACREDADAAVTTTRAHRDNYALTTDRLNAEQVALDAELGRQLAELGLPDVAALVERQQDAVALVALRDLQKGLRKARTGAEATLGAAGRHHARHRTQRPEGLPDEATPEAIEPELTELATARGAHREKLDQARATLQIAERDRDARAGVERELQAATTEARVWLHLHDLIGKGDGKRFKLFAQALNLSQLLVQANRHLVHLNERYRLRSELDPETALPTLEFVVEDQWRPGTTRSLKTLSGGESFLVSLALALGLSDLRTSSMPVETLLLDEGFGTLDPQTLDTALAALQQLQASGRQVGIISHVVGLQERIEARVLVEPMGEGRSRVRAEVGLG